MNYPVYVKPDGDEYFEITCRDLPELNAIAYSKEDIEQQAQDALETTFMLYMTDRKTIPLASKKQDGEILVNLPLRYDFKIALYNEALKQGITKAEMARRINATQKQIDRIWSVDHPTKLETLEEVFKALNKSVSLNIKLTSF